MKKIIRILPFFLFILLLDRFFFLPGRMDATWQYEKGINLGDPITFDNIEIINNFEVMVRKSGEFNSCYLLGCYFGNLYLLDSKALKYTKYTEIEEFDFLY
ncbi:hypothetical protein L1S35_04835 [Flavobacterium sp. AS60]|uniref:hypothetical protein n=1 Tax=Flavobacterium anseongense TaxID=2910677 RepID=UPI001F454DBF|nr:hypothetical protein [Flavobacterium sp. AS60]MCF6128988.1 hypothetical protein [Flavobacterium sp. AS60]